MTLLLLPLFLSSCFAIQDYAYPLYITSIQEGNEKTENFFSVALQDASGDNITYSMTPMIDSRSSKFFELNSRTGTVSVISDIDREFMDVHYFKVVAKSLDSSTTSTTTIQINVEDINDNSPKFEQSVYNASVKESIKVGSSILTVRANDPDADENGRVTYEINDSEFFRIGTSSGIISTRKSLDRETKDRHDLIIIATDNGSPPNQRRSSNVSVLIFIADENDNHPQFDSRIYYVDLDEDRDWKREPILTTVSAIDNDIGDNAKIKYAIIGGNNDDVFRIDPNSGELRIVKGVLDRESVDHYKLIIRAQDLGNPPKSNTTQFVIRLNDVNDNAPKFPSMKYYQSVAENVPDGYSVLQMTAFDPDLGENARIEYSLKESNNNNNNNNNNFEIDSESGWIRTIRTLDRETSHSYILSVIARDHGKPKSLSSTATVHIDVLDRNDNDPRFSKKSYEVRVSESAELGTIILTVSAIDHDESDSTLRYEIVGGNTRNRFSISTQRGRGLISVTQPLDYNFERNFYLHINAVDSGGRFGSAVVVVNVTDSNNHSPIFQDTPYAADVFEDTPIGSTVMILFATDQDSDENAKLTYSLSSPSLKFRIESDTGAVIVSDQLDRESSSTYILSVLVQDHGRPHSLSDRTEVEISVLDINDNNPTFSQFEYLGSVYEDASVGTSVLEVTAVDIDSNDNAKIRYRFRTNDDDDKTTHFTIDRYSGVIRTRNLLDRESTEQYRLIVEAVDSGIPELSGSCQVVIRVLDVNDNPPRFENDTLYFTLAENSAVGTKIGVIRAFDADLDDNAHITYFLIDDPDSSLFEIQSEDHGNGVVLRSRKEFDYESDFPTRYEITIRAESIPLHSEVVVVILITDENDNVPELVDFRIVFNHRDNDYYLLSSSLTSLTSSTSTSTTSTSVIGRVPASDKDPTSRLTYGFTYGNSAKMVRLNETTGEIRLSSSFYSTIPIRAKIGVSISDGKNEVRANLFLEVNYVSVEMLDHSVTLRFKNVSKLEFLSPYYSYFLEALSVILPCEPRHIHVFSIKSDIDTILNVTFSVSNSGIHDTERYWNPSIIKQRIFLHSELMTKLMLLEQVPFDENLCVQEPCLNFEECRIVTRFGNHYDYVSNDIDVMFRSVEPITTYKCVCPIGYTGMTTRYTCDIPINLCYSSPCRNNGTCISKENGYVCICDTTLYAGVNCEISLKRDDCRKVEEKSLCKPPSQCSKSNTSSVLFCRNCTPRNRYYDSFCRLQSRSFSIGTYVAFDSLRIRNFVTISLEFASQNSKGLLFYNGRLNGLHDYMALSYRRNVLRFSYSMGGDRDREITVIRDSKFPFSDGDFHTVEISITPNRIRLSYDGCDTKLALRYGDRLETRWKCSNETRFDDDDGNDVQLCNPYLGLNCRKSFDLSGPFLLGGIPWNKRDDRISTDTFTGCIKNVVIDHELVDMNDYVHNNGTISGCPEKRGFCGSSPCQNSGRCYEGWGSYYCKCRDGWDGKNCNFKVTSTLGLLPDSVVTFKTEIYSIKVPWYIIVSFKTEKENGTLLRVGIGNKGDNASTLYVRNGYITYSYLTTTEMTLDSKRIDDGEWHNVQIKWMSSEVWLNLDYGQREMTIKSRNFLNEEIVSSVQVKNFFGCLRNVRVGSSIDSPELKVALQRDTGQCRLFFANSTTATDTTNSCVLKDVINNQCLDFCDLDLCENNSRCRNVTDNDGTSSYRCECNHPSSISNNNRYCQKQISKQICPNHWWGTPVCGPCNCDVTRGFKETCDKTNGRCSCKDYFYRSNNEDSCEPCGCNVMGSESRTCDDITGQCKCKSGIIGQRCDLCAHRFAELGPQGCKVVYGNCPAEMDEFDIEWKRTPIGYNASSPCSKRDSKGIAIRICTLNGWNVPDTSQCIHNEFLKLTTDFRDESWKSIFWAFKLLFSNDRNQRRLQGGGGGGIPIYAKDVETISKLIRNVIRLEIEKRNFEYAHMKERHFLSHLFRIVSWIYRNSYTKYVEKLELMELLYRYGTTISNHMDTTFTNPFEIISDDVIFGLDTTSSTTLLPKYNNYMRSSNAWNEISAILPTTTTNITVFQYVEYNATGLAILDRNRVSIRDLRWGTLIRHFSNIFSLQFSSPDNERSDDNSPSILYRGKLRNRHNRLYCVYLTDRRIWTSLDCESSLYRHSETTISINCTCTKKGTFTVIEELVEEQHDYLDDDDDDDLITILFLSVTLFSLFLLLSTGLLLFLCQDHRRRKNSITIHRNITLVFWIQHTFIVLSVAFNSTFIDSDIVCKLVTMSLHYFSIATFLWTLLDSIHIYRMLKELRDINHGKMNFYTVIGFGIPAVIVGLTVGVSGNHYGSATFCWFSYRNITSWSMFIPESVSVILQIGLIFLSLNAVFTIREDIEDFTKLRRVFFVTTGLVPFISGTHISAYLLMNFRTRLFLFVYSGCLFVTSTYFLFGFVGCDPLIRKPLMNCSCFKGRKNNKEAAMTLSSKSALNYSIHQHHQQQQQQQQHHQHQHRHQQPYLDGDSAASTTSRSSNQFKEYLNSTDDDKLYTNMFHSNVSESDSDIERRSLDLASSHSSDEDPMEEKQIYTKKTLFVNDYPSQH